MKKKVLSEQANNQLLSNIYGPLKYLGIFNEAQGFVNKYQNSVEFQKNSEEILQTFRKIERHDLDRIKKIEDEYLSQALKELDSYSEDKVFVVNYVNFLQQWMNNYNIKSLLRTIYVPSMLFLLNEIMLRLITSNAWDRVIFSIIITIGQIIQLSVLTANLYEKNKQNINKNVNNDEKMKNIIKSFTLLEMNGTLTKQAIFTSIINSLENLIDRILTLFGYLFTSVDGWLLMFFCYLSIKILQKILELAF